MGTGVESSWEGCRQNHPEPELRARLVLSPLPRALISMLVLSSAWLPRQRGDLMLFMGLHCPRWVQVAMWVISPSLTLAVCSS